MTTSEMRRQKNVDLNFSQGKVFKSVTVKRVNDMQTGQTDVTCLDALCM